MDLISSFVDSGECSDLIVSQQQYYISELNRLLDRIDEEGNCTGLKPEKFEVFLKFIYYLREYAYKKIEAIEEIKKKYGIKN